MKSTSTIYRGSYTPFQRVVRHQHVVSGQTVGAIRDRGWLVCVILALQPDGSSRWQLHRVIRKLK